MTKCCVLCGHTDLRAIDQITFGTWQTDASELVRDSNHYWLTECVRCKHVQMSADYQATLFETLYFHSTQEEVMWHELLIGSLQPYLDMVSFCSEFIQPNALIADFGCGTGSLLQAVQCSEHKTQQLHGVDFNDRLSFSNIRYHSADLNDNQALKQLDLPKNIGLACASHTLEHVLNPVEFLSSLKRFLSDEGVIFIEVPDFSRTLAPHLAGLSNLVNLQHTQYFTLDSLRYTAHKAGLDIKKTRQIVTGYIPRLQVILAPYLEGGVLTSHLYTNNNSARGCVSDLIAKSKAKRAIVVNQVIEHLSSEQALGLWGIGADFYLMTQEHPILRTHIENKKVTLFDYELAGKTLFQQTIKSSADIKNFTGIVYMTPVLAETRYKMHQVSLHWQSDIRDSYQNDMLDVPPIHSSVTEQSMLVHGSMQTPPLMTSVNSSVENCMLCQSANWRHIDKITSGVWDKSTKALQRKELTFLIGVCEQCQHTQIYTPYTRATFQHLYFTHIAQPEMWFIAKGQPSPYDEMVDMFAHLLPNMRHIADFGCGEGLLLEAIEKKQPHAELAGFDFNIQGNGHTINRFSCDLNCQKSLANAGAGLQFNLITSSHVLEHVLNPVSYLNGLSRQLTQSGYLFIEVPDASNVNADLALHNTNLVHGQHIHYFTKDSLDVIAQRAGLRRVEYRQLLTGDIPRLQMLFKKNNDSLHVSSITESGELAVRARFNQYNRSIERLADSIKSKLQSERNVGLWGIGGDVYQLFLQQPSIATLVKDGTIILFDHELVGHEYWGQKILASSQIIDSPFSIFIGPMYRPTRDKMLALSESWQANNVINAYSD